MNPNLSYLLACTVGGLTLIGVIVLDIFKVPDTSFIGFAGGIFSVLIALAGNKTQNQSIEAKVNGNLSKLLSAALDNGHAQTVAEIAAETGVAPTGPEEHP